MNQNILAKIQSYGLNVIETVTNPTRAGKQPKPVWNINGINLSRYEHILRDQMGLKKWRGQFSAWEDPTEQLLELLQSGDAMTIEELHHYQVERSLERVERLEEQAGKHQQAGAAKLQQADDISQRFYMGQPILVGHHSEQGARRDQERMWNKTKQGINQQKYAGHLSEQAAAAERHAESKTKCSLEYVGNRIEEAEATLRKVERERSVQTGSEVIVPDGRKGIVFGIVKPKGKSKNKTSAATQVKVEFSNLPDQKPEWGTFNLDNVQLVLSDCYRQQLELKCKTAEQDLEYWQQKYSELGGDRYSKETIKVGDYIKYWSGWRKVVRVNAKSVTVETGYSWTDTVPYHKLTGHLTKESYAARLSREQSGQNSKEKVAERP